MKRVKRSIIAIAGLALVGVTAACGSGGSDGTSSDGIVLGSMQDLTGSNAPYGTSVQKGIDLAVEQFNAAGGFEGEQVTIEKVDLGSDPAAVTAAVRKLSSKGVIGIQGPTTSAAFKLSAPVAQQQKVLVSAPTSVENFDAGVLNDWTKRVAPIQANAWPQIMGTLLEASGNPERIAVFLNPANTASVQEAGLIEDYASEGGYEVQVETSPEGQTNVTAVVSRTLAFNPDAIFMAYGGAAEASTFMKGIRERGSDVPFIGSASFTNAELFKLAGAAGEGTHVMVAFLDSPDAGEVAQRFVADFKKKYGSAPDTVAAEGFDSTNAMLQAMVKAKSTDRDKIRAAYDGLSFEGALGQLSYGSGPDNAAPEFQLAQVRNGALAPPSK